jgi:hypothetical protein
LKESITFGETSKLFIIERCFLEITVYVMTVDALNLLMWSTEQLCPFGLSPFAVAQGKSLDKTGVSGFYVIII